MPTESKTLTAERVRKERALATMRELQLQQLQGTLLPAAEVEATWSNAILRMRNAMLSIPARIASQFPDPKFAENILRGEIETALRQLQTKGRE